MLRKNLIAALSVVFLTLAPVKGAYASDFLFYKELNLLGGYTKQKGWVGYSQTLSNSIGFEHYAKFSSDYGDYLTTDIQIRGAYDPNQKFNEAISCEIHNAWAEYRASDILKLKAGHFDPAFGLEPIVDTHSTILQTLMIRDIGFKKDWGISLNGSFPHFDYEAAIQLGSGMSIRRIDSSYLVTVRIGTPSNNDFQYGISGLIGNVLATAGMSTFPKNHLLSNEAVYEKRLGFDCQYNWRSFLFKAETAYGSNDEKNVIGYLIEADYTPAGNQNWEFDAQFQSWVNDLAAGNNNDSTFGFSLSYKLSRSVTLRAALMQDVNLYNKPEDTKAYLQFYYYG